jgi:hypothetical protein
MGRYSHAGAQTLVNEQLGGDVYASGGWIGFQKDSIAIIDPKEITEISEVNLGTFVNPSSWIFNASEFSIYGSEDNTSYTQYRNRNIRLGNISEGTPSSKKYPLCKSRC